jgi:hypothetical protein
MGDAPFLFVHQREGTLLDIQGDAGSMQLAPSPALCSYLWFHIYAQWVDCPRRTSFLCTGWFFLSTQRRQADIIGEASACMVRSMCDSPLSFFVSESFARGDRTSVLGGKNRQAEHRGQARIGMVGIHMACIEVGSRAVIMVPLVCSI